MGNKAKSFVAAVALFALLFFGPATSAQAGHFGPHVSFQGHFPLPHGSIHVNVGNGHRFKHHSYYPRHRYARPYHGRFYYKHHRPYRLVRVRVFDPYPRWVLRRVYYSQPVGAYFPY